MTVPLPDPLLPIMPLDLVKTLAASTVRLPMPLLPTMTLPPEFSRKFPEKVIADQAGFGKSAVVKAAKTNFGINRGSEFIIYPIEQCSNLFKGNIR